MGHFLDPSGSIGTDGLAKLAQAQLHVVKVGDGLHQRLADIGQHRLELPEGLARTIGIFGVDRLVGLGTGNEDHHTPVGIAFLPICLTVVGREEVQHLAVNVRLAALLEFAADVGGDGLDVALQAIHILEDGVVDALQHIVGRIGLGGDHFVGIVYQPAAQRTYFTHCPLRVEMGYDR